MKQKLDSTEMWFYSKFYKTSPTKNYLEKIIKHFLASQVQMALENFTIFDYFNLTKRRRKWKPRCL